MRGGEEEKESKQVRRRRDGNNESWPRVKGRHFTNKRKRGSNGPIGGLVVLILDINRNNRKNGAGDYPNDLLHSLARVSEGRQHCQLGDALIRPNPERAYEVVQFDGHTIPEAVL